MIKKKSRNKYYQYKLYDRLRHFIRYKLKIFIKHLTLKKLLNFLLLNIQYYFKNLKVKGYPFYLIIDVNNTCNLKCPLCTTGQGRSGRDKGQMSFETFKKVFDVFADYAFVVLLYNWGEPFLNKDLFKMIAYAQSRNVSTQVSTNLNFLNEGDAQKLIASGVEHLKVAIDGITRESYQKYRRGGNLKTVFGNLEKIVKAKKAQKNKTPFIEWQFLVMKANEGEIQKAREKALELGVDDINFMPILLLNEENVFCRQSDFEKLAEEWLPSKESGFYIDYSSLITDSPCSWLWRGIVINHDGGLSPCCVPDDKQSDFGNILETGFKEIWNNEKYVYARSLFKKSKTKLNVRKIPCLICRYVKKINN